MLEVLYEDKHIIICIKPAGILSADPDSGMMKEISDYRSLNGEDTYVGVVHRLDRAVGGIMVYAKTPKAAAVLSKAVAEREFEKEYLAIIHGKPEENSGMLEDLLFKDSAKNKSYVVKRMRKGVKKASLEYLVLGDALYKDSPVSLVKIKLHTGRTHQIRVQFSSRKMPLVGDGKYGGKDNGCDVALWSARLAFSHPVTGERIDISAPMPQGEVWNLFK